MKYQSLSSFSFFTRSCLKYITSVLNLQFTDIFCYFFFIVCAQNYVYLQYVLQDILITQDGSGVYVLLSFPPTCHSVSSSCLLLMALTFLLLHSPSSSGVIITAQHDTLSLWDNYPHWTWHWWTPGWNEETGNSAKKDNNNGYYDCL